jgi:hypothetical protein
MVTHIHIRPHGKGMGLTLKAPMRQTESRELHVEGELCNSKMIQEQACSGRELQWKASFVKAR